MNAPPVAHAMDLQFALTLMERTSVNVVSALLGMDLIVKITTNVRAAFGVAHSHLAITRWDRSAVPVMMDTLAMESRVKVRVLFLVTLSVIIRPMSLLRKVPVLVMSIYFNHIIYSSYSGNAV